MLQGGEGEGPVGIGAFLGVPGGHLVEGWGLGGLPSLNCVRLRAHSLKVRSRVTEISRRNSREKSKDIPVDPV